MVPIGDQERYLIGTSTKPRGTDLFVCIGHGGYDEQKGEFTRVPPGSIVCFYNSHEKTLTTTDVREMIAAPYGKAKVPIRSIAGGAAEIWDYRVFPFTPGEKTNSEGGKYDEFDIVAGYRETWLEAMGESPHPYNDLILMNIDSDAYKGGQLAPVYLSDIFALLPAYTRYHWCACRSLIQPSGGWLGWIW
jgi:hypothetical protein